MWVYLDYAAAWVTYTYEYIASLLFGNRYAIRHGRLIRTVPEKMELCLIKVSSWRKQRWRLARGPALDAFDACDATAYKRVLDVSIGDCQEDEVSHFLTPMACNFTDAVSAQGSEICALAAVATGCDVSGEVHITYMDMSTDTFGPLDTIVIR